MKLRSDKRSIIMIVILAIVLSIFVENKRSALRTSMEKYLETTYNRDFEITRPKFNYSMIRGFVMHAIASTEDKGVIIENDVFWSRSYKEHPIQSNIITKDIWSNSALTDFNNIVKNVYGSSAIMVDFYNRLKLNFTDEEIWFADEYAGSLHRYKDYLDKDYEYIVNLAKSGRERIKIRLSYLVIVEELVEEEEIKKIFELTDKLQIKYNHEEICLNVYFVTPEYVINSNEILGVELAEKVPCDLDDEGNTLKEERKLLGSIFVSADKYNKISLDRIMRELKRIKQ